MTPDESAWAQTLRELLNWVPMLSGVVRPTNAPSWRTEVVPALTAAIAALEAKPACTYCGTNIPAAREEALDAKAQAPSETAKDERILELTAAIQHIDNLAHGVMTRPPLTPSKLSPDGVALRLVIAKARENLAAETVAKVNALSSEVLRDQPHTFRAPRVALAVSCLVCDRAEFHPLHQEPGGTPHPGDGSWSGGTP